jgi:L-fucose isomerase-like protein
MLKPKVGFIVFGVHKDGLEDPMEQPFIDDDIIANARKSLKDSGLELVEHDTVIATKEEAKECFGKFKKMDDLDAVVLFSGTWVWAANLIAAVRDFAFTGKGLILWTNPGSQGWRPVGGLVMQAAMKEIGIKHRFVYGSCDDAGEIEKITSYCRASAIKNLLNMSTIGTFGGRGMGQTCGAADPSQWMKYFGVDIDSRDTTELLNTAKAVTDKEVVETRKRIQPLF